MKFVISSVTLLKHLQSISGVLSTSNSLPILDNFLFEIKEGKLTASASDLETTMRTGLAVESEDSGLVAIPAKLLLDVLKNLPDQPCTFKVGENFQIEIAYDNGKSKMNGYNGEEFPLVPALNDANSITLSSGILSNAINKTLFATGVDDLRPVMSGVFCEFSPESITFVATDAHKLVKYTRSDAQATGSSSFIIPKKPLNLLKNNLSSNEDDIKIEYNDSNAVFTFGDITLICRLIDGKFPNYEAVIPKENPNVLRIDRATFLSSIKRVSIFANKTTHQIKLKLVGSELSLSAEDIDFSNEAKERLTCNYNGEDLTIGFNSRFLMEMLNNLNSEEVRLEMSEPSRAGLLMPADDNDHEDILMLVMPVMLNS